MYRHCQTDMHDLVCACAKTVRPALGVVLHPSSFCKQDDSNGSRGEV